MPLTVEAFPIVRLSSLMTVEHPFEGGDQGREASERRRLSQHRPVIARRVSRDGRPGGNVNHACYDNITLGGNDDITGDAGDDIVLGGQGVDSVRGGEGVPGR